MKKLAAFSMLLLTGCLGSEKRATPDNGPEKPSFGFIQSLQYAITSTTMNASVIREYLSFLQSRVIVASADSDLTNITAPAAGCLFEVEDGVNLGAIRYLDVGDFKLRGADIGEKVFDKNPTPNATSYSVPNFLLTLGSAYQIETTGVNGQLAWKQDFLVPAAGANLGLHQTFNNQNYDFALPSPVLYSPIRDADRALINRLTDFKITYTAPAGTTYVKAHLNDGGGGASANRYGNVVCYGDPNGSITVPGGLLANFKSTADGLLTLDFVAVNRRTDISRVRESAVISVTRHHHGRLDLDTPSGKATIQFGVLGFD